jgi:hypothetical protein
MSRRHRSIVCWLIDDRLSSIWRTEYQSLGQPRGGNGTAPHNDAAAASACFHMLLPSSFQSMEALIASSTRTS